MVLALGKTLRWHDAFPDEQTHHQKGEVTRPSPQVGKGQEVGLNPSHPTSDPLSKSELSHLAQFLKLGKLRIREGGPLPKVTQLG